MTLLAVSCLLQVDPCVCPSVCPKVNLFACPFVCPLVLCLSVWSSICLSVHQSVCLSVRLSICLPVHKSVFQKNSDYCQTVIYHIALETLLPPPLLPSPPQLRV